MQHYITFKSERKQFRRAFGPRLKLYRTEKIRATQGYRYLLDSSNQQRSMAPNLLHFYDSNLLNHVLQRLLAKNVAVFPNHDCFYSLSTQEALVREAYNYCLFHLFVERCQMTHLFQIHGLNLHSFEETQSIFMEISFKE